MYNLTFSDFITISAMLLMLSSTSSTSTTQWSGGAFSIDSMKVHIWIDQQLAVILQFQIVTAKCYGPESWAEGWGLYNRLGMSEAEQMKLTVEVTGR